MQKVLIIDDDDIVVFVQRKMLERCGIVNEPICFKSASQALDFLTSENTSIDYLVFLDINMPPGMTGWQLLEKLRAYEVYHRLNVIMVTSSIDKFDKNMANTYEKVIGFIEKPVSAEDCLQLKSHPALRQFFKQEKS